jgi:sporulation protein YlmC with PRC-barrel domain
MRSNNREYHNSKKGHQGFMKKYQALGETKHIRVPMSIVKKVKHILILLEAIAYDKGIDKVNNILDKVIEGLEGLQ